MSDAAADRRNLEAKLLARLRHDIDECQRFGYSPHVFIGMISKHGPVVACIRVVTAWPPPDGFLKLLELDRLDLNAERTVLDGPWRRLFSGEVLDAARKRLRQYERPDLIVE